LVTDLEDLSYLTYSESEKAALAEDLEKLIAQTRPVTEVNTEGIAECVQPFDTVNVFRTDEVVPSYDRELILKNAANHNDEMFIAPKTVE
jgi:aspartyl-tRNA(Asn)/glutamyl-tRNA(Gln) amidotransferase subunit C